MRDGLSAPVSSSHGFRSLTTTAQDWPIAPVPLPVQSRGIAGPTFGSRPEGIQDAARFSLLPFLPPQDMQVQIRAANDDGEYEALDAAFVTRLANAPARTTPRMNGMIMFAAGVVIGIAVTLLLH